MPRRSFRFAGAAVMLASIALASPALALDGPRPRETRAERREFRSHRYSSAARVGGRGDSIYPPYYDAARSYYGGRGDDRWRWTESARPGYWGSPFMGPFGFYGWNGY